MKDLRAYQIPFVGLKLEEHHFNFVLEDAFFSHFEDSLVKQGKVFVDLIFDKKDRLFVLNFDISGSVASECDRCGQAFDLPIHGNYTMYVKVGDEREEDKDNEDVIWISDGDSVLDVSEMMYEFVHLSIPIKKTHPDKKNGEPGCDPEILKLLATEKEEEDKKEIDPRWDILNNLSKN